MSVRRAGNYFRRPRSVSLGCARSLLVIIPSEDAVPLTATSALAPSYTVARAVAECGVAAARSLGVAPSQPTAPTRRGPDEQSHSQSGSSLAVDVVARHSKFWVDPPRCSYRPGCRRGVLYNTMGFFTTL